MTPEGHGGGSPMSTRDRITFATLELLGEGGYSSITMSAVAARAGISRQTLYNHFPDVDQILEIAVEQHNREAISMLDSSMSVVDGPDDALVQLVRHVLAVASHGGHSPAAQGALPPAARSRLADYRRAVDVHIGRILNSGRSDGSFSTALDAEVDGVLVRGVLDGAAEFVSDSPDRTAAVATAAVHSLRAMLSR